MRKYRPVRHTSAIEGLRTLVDVTSWLFLTQNGPPSCFLGERSQTRNGSSASRLITTTTPELKFSVHTGHVEQKNWPSE
jgi:hypothetical protein